MGGSDKQGQKKAATACKFDMRDHISGPHVKMWVTKGKMCLLNCFVKVNQ